MEQFKCRASAAGKLLTNPLKKTDLLSKTTQSFIEEWLKEKIYGVRKEISSKQIEKGVMFEDLGIDKAIEWLDLPLAIKNKKRFEDDFFTGEPDLLLSDEVIDIKISWDCFTFPLFDVDIPTKDYEAQVQVYMHLTGLRKASVVYVLLDTPETPYSMAITYDHVDKSKRIKRYQFTYNPEIIKKLQGRVTLCREFINTLIT